MILKTGIGLIILSAISLLPAEKPLTVCEVLSNLDRYRGKIVPIRGIISGGFPHGYAIYDYDQDEDPCPDILKRGLRWPSSMAITWPDASDVEDGPRTFQPNIKETNKNLAKVERLLQEKYSQGREIFVVVATFVGEVRSRKDIEIFQRDDGAYIGTGYGPGGQRPANIVLKTLRDVELIRPRK